MFITVGWRFFQFSLLATENPIFLWKLPISKGKEFIGGGYHLAVDIWHFLHMNLSFPSELEVEAAQL